MKRRLRSSRAVWSWLAACSLAITACSGSPDCLPKPAAGAAISTPPGVVYANGERGQRSEVSLFITQLRAGSVAGVANRELGVPSVADAKWIVDHFTQASKGRMKIKFSEYAGDLGMAPVCLTFWPSGEHLFVGVGYTSPKNSWQMTYSSAPHAENTAKPDKIKVECS